MVLAEQFEQRNVIIVEYIMWMRCCMLMHLSWS